MRSAKKLVKGLILNDEEITQYARQIVGEDNLLGVIARRWFGESWCSDKDEGIISDTISEMYFYKLLPEQLMVIGEFAGWRRHVFDLGVQAKRGKKITTLQSHYAWLCDVEQKEKTFYSLYMPTYSPAETGFQYAAGIKYMINLGLVTFKSTQHVIGFLAAYDKWYNCRAANYNTEGLLLDIWPSWGSEATGEELQLLTLVGISRAASRLGERGVRLHSPEVLSKHIKNSWLIGWLKEYPMPSNVEEAQKRIQHSEVAKYAVKRHWKDYGLKGENPLSETEYPFKDLEASPVLAFEEAHGGENKFLLWYHNGTGWYDCVSSHPTLRDAIQASRCGWQTPHRITHVNGNGNSPEDVVWED